MAAYTSALGDMHTSPMTAPDPAADTETEIFDAEIVYGDDGGYPDAEINEPPPVFEELAEELPTTSCVDREGGTAFLDFREPFDGMQREIPLAEQKAAGAALSDFAAECLEGCPI